jgi:Fe2+ or Zn2+ uptake regulation protein
VHLHCQSVARIHREFNLSIKPNNDWAEGGRMTGQRAIILDVIATSCDHLTADDITARAARSQHQLLDGVSHPDAVEGTGSHQGAVLRSRQSPRSLWPNPQTEHYHFTCTRCSKVIEFQSEYVPALRSQLQAELGVNVARVHLSLTGLCEKCEGSKA